MRMLALFILSLGLLPGIASAESTNPNLLRPLPGGICFPTLYSSIETNPAALLQEKKTVVALEWQLPQPGIPANVTEGFAAGGKFFGFGALLGASSIGNSLTMSRVSMGAAIGMTGSSLGANLVYDIASGSGIDIDLGMAVENISGFQLSMLMTSVQRFQTLGAFNVGMGFSVPRQFQVEANWSYTLFSVEQKHIISVDTILQASQFAFGLRLAYTNSTAGSGFLVGPSMSFEFSPRVIFSARGFYDTSTGTRAIFAANLAF